MTHPYEWLNPIGTQKGHKVTNGQPKQAKGVQETAPNPSTWEPGGTKRPVVQIVGMCNKSMAQIASLDYTIMNDNG
jgi:hypothetical protein